MTSKSEKKKRLTYSKEVMAMALAAVKSGTPINAASKLYSVPRSSLHSKVVNKYTKKETTGPPTLLSKDVEEMLAKWILRMCSMGCPITKDHLLNSVAIYAKNKYKNKKENPFVKGRPGRHWYLGFLRRHPEIVKRVSENVSIARALVSEDSVRKWFCDIGEYLRKKGLLEIEACRVFNTDETALSLNPTGGYVLAEEGKQNVHSIVNNNEKENLTTLVTGNAAGQLAPTLVVMDYVRVPRDIYAKLPKNFLIGTSDKGWMTGMLFYEYIANSFYPWLITEKIELPVILYLDGHVSHLTQPLSEFSSKHQIVLIVLPPNTTHMMQPMDVSMFSPLKVHFTKAVNLYRINNNILSVTKADFSQLLNKVFEGMELVKISKNGSKRCGLMPFDVDAVDFTKLFIRSQTTEKPTNAEDAGMKELTLLESIEKDIDPALLQTFKDHEKDKEWTGVDKHFYYFWRKFHDACVECHFVHNQTDMPNEALSTSEQADDHPTIVAIIESLQVSKENLIDLQSDTHLNINYSFYYGDDGNVIIDDPSITDLLFSVFNDSNIHIEIGDLSSVDNISIETISGDSEAILSQEIINSESSADKVLDKVDQHKNKDIKAGPLQDITNSSQLVDSNQANSKNAVNCSNAYDQENVSQNILDPKIPTQFKQHIYFSRTVISKNKRLAADKMPSSLSSEQGLKWHDDRDEKKKKADDEKETRKKKRADNFQSKKEKAEEIEMKKEEKAKLIKIKVEKTEEKPKKKKPKKLPARKQSSVRTRKRLTKESEETSPK